MGPNAWLAVAVAPAFVAAACFGPRPLAALGTAGGLLLTTTVFGGVISGAAVTVSKGDLKHIMQKGSLRLLPQSEGLLAGVGVMSLLFCSPIAALLPLSEASARSTSGGRIFPRRGADAALGAVVALHILIGLVCQGLRQVTPIRLLCPSWLSPVVPQLALWLGGLALYAAVLVPASDLASRTELREGAGSSSPSALAAQQTQLTWWLMAARHVPRRVAFVGLAAAAAALAAALGDLARVASLVGGVLQCIHGLVLMPLLALWSVPWPTSSATMWRCMTIVLGMGCAVISVYAAFRWP
eukprot:gnl/TRDRNA2_/TRDRNA2_152656_c1_seq1.p2 gnl/TRDRNA2_/TRDRNA2_152656_c1~~gnl/TRDRNA2_/TRDRNA2_152656_c1_seq1.p2  ORF type:complete len:335 (+),score=54.06 gnl/TRDRNA2_/TRDRNA2_152656_c1_seq1:112-1005(+)